MSEPAPGLAGPHGGDALVAVMDAHGVDTAFGVVSVHNLPLVEAVARTRRFVPVRHEAAAVNAADGFARATGGLGVAITSTGTGAGNAAGSLIEALAAGSRVLHVTGQIDSPYLGRQRGFIHETKDQLAMLEAVSKSAWSIGPGDRAVDVMAAAVASALTLPHGPASVEWPVDLQYAVQSADYRPHEVVAPPRPDAASVVEAARRLQAASRPVIWAGGGATGARDELLELLTRTRAGLLTSNAGRGSVPETHPACIGNFATSPASRAVLEEADLVLSIGTHFRSNETADYTLALPAEHIAIDVDPAAIGRVYPSTVGIVGDAAAVLRAVLAELGEHTATDASWLTVIAGARREVRHVLRSAIGWNADINDVVRKALPQDAVIARDVTIPSSTWGNRLLTIEQARTNLFPHGGGIGQGLAMGLGAAISAPDRPTLVLVGDGGLAVHLGELLTLAQEQPWLVVLVFDDGGYGVLRNTQESFVGARSGVDLFTPDFVDLAAAIDVPVWDVRTSFEAERAMAEAVALQGPAIVRVDVGALGPTPVTFTPPVSIPTQ